VPDGAYFNSSPNARASVLSSARSHVRYPTFQETRDVQFVPTLGTLFLVLRFLTKPYLSYSERELFDFVFCARSAFCSLLGQFMERFLFAFLFVLVIFSLKRSWDLQKRIGLQEDFVIALFQGRVVLYFVIEVEHKTNKIPEVVEFLRMVFDGKWDYVYVNDQSIKPEEENFTQFIVVSYKYVENYDNSDITQRVRNQLLEKLPTIFDASVSVEFGRTTIEALNKLRVGKLNKAEDTVI
jgi:hypothetical protein